MSQVLAALFGGLGSGASSLGQSRMVEQEQRRREQAAEQARIAAAREAGAQRVALEREKQEERLRQQKAAAAVAKLMGVDVPDDVPLTTDGVRLIADDRRAKAAAAAEEGRTSRANAANQSRMDLLEARIEAERAVREAQAEALRARASRDERYEPTQPQPKDDPIEKQVIEQALKLSSPSKDDDGFTVPGLPIQQARDSAQVLVRGARGLPMPERSGGSAAPAGSALLGGLGLQPRGGGNAPRGLEAEFPGQAEQIQRARAAGYSDEEIRRYLGGGR